MFGTVIKKKLIGGAVMASILLSSAYASADQIIALQSGNGSVGGQDADITMLVGPPNSAFGGAFGASDFAAAQAGTQAFIINRHGAWLPPSSFSNPAAQWISTSPIGAALGSSALFAINFTITDLALASADIVFNFAADNMIGGGPNQGLYLNGIALSGDTTGVGFNSESTIVRNDIAPLLVNGLNTLYINLTDVGGPSGLLFSTTITTTAAGVTVPEPATLTLFGLGLLGLGAARRRRRSA